MICLDPKVWRKLVKQWYSSEWWAWGWVVVDVILFFWKVIPAVVRLRDAILTITSEPRWSALCWGSIT